MKHSLDCQALTREALAEHLDNSQITRAEAIGEASVYHCRTAEGDSIAIAMPGDSGLLIRLQKTISRTLDRRRGHR